MRIELTGDQRQRLIRALHMSFNQLTLDAMLNEKLGRQLADSVPAIHAWNTTPTTLQQSAYRESWNDDLVLASAAYAPQDAELARLVMELGLSAAGPGRLSVSASVRVKNAALGSLEGLVNTASELQDVAAFINALTQLQYQVCRIETDDTPTRALGTGFLVGDDLVLTNWHVAEAIQKFGLRAGCRFDYRADASGLAVNMGFAIPFVNDGWLLQHSPYAGSDIDRNGAPPTAAELDYALIRIAKPVAGFAPGKDAPVAGAEARGYMRLDQNAVVPRINDELFVLQHPDGKPMKLAVGQVLETVVDPAAPLRLRHDSTTEGGSSGSPCFNANLKLVALHHATDPENPVKPTYNQAIPIGLIHRELQAAGRLQ